MNLLDTYLNEVGRHLPAKSRADIQAEIRSVLEDMLEERSKAAGRPVDDEMIFDVLKEYGEPEKVAASYRPEQYLIGPRLFPVFLMVARIVLPIMGVLALVGLGIALGRVELTAQGVTTTVAQAIAEFFNAMITALGTLVIIFAIIERFAPDVREFPKAWDPRSLLKVSQPDQIKLAEPIVEIVFTVAALLIFNLYPQLIGIGYVDSANFWFGIGSQQPGWHFIPLLSEAFFRFIPFLNVLWVLQIVMDAILLRDKQWTPLTRWFQIALKAGSIGIAAAMLAGPSIIGLTAQTLADSGPMPLASAGVLVDMMQVFVKVALFLAIFGSGVEIIKHLVRLLKPQLPVEVAQIGK
jgi:hypothetical protein